MRLTVVMIGFVKKQKGLLQSEQALYLGAGPERG